MKDMGVVNGLSQLGYSTEDIPQLVEGTLPQVQHTHTWLFVLPYLCHG